MRCLSALSFFLSFLRSEEKRSLAPGPLKNITGTNPLFSQTSEACFSFPFLLFGKKTHVVWLQGEGDLYAGWQITQREAVIITIANDDKLRRPCDRPVAKTEKGDAKDDRHRRPQSFDPHGKRLGKLSEITNWLLTG
jgi:hypothetical protein